MFGAAGAVVRSLFENTTDDFGVSSLSNPYTEYIYELKYASPRGLYFPVTQAPVLSME
jgi:hypothetical protein